MLRCVHLVEKEVLPDQFVDQELQVRRRLLPLLPLLAIGSQPASHTNPDFRPNLRSDRSQYAPPLQQLLQCHTWSSKEGRKQQAAHSSVSCPVRTKNPGHGAPPAVYQKHHRHHQRPSVSHGPACVTICHAPARSAVLGESFVSCSKVAPARLADRTERGCWPAMELLRSVLALCLLLAVLLGQSSMAQSKGVKPITDSEVRRKKLACIEEINNGMWGSKCKASPINRENCALRCVSGACYQLLYADDPLEEGEVEFHRGRDFRMCVRRESKGLPLSVRSLYE